MAKTIDSNTRFYIDIDIKTKKVIGWDQGQRHKLEQELPGPNHRRIFVTHGQYNKLIKENQMKSYLIAPCGMNCALCMAYLREKNHCPGCGNKAIGACQKCVIKNCGTLKKNKMRFCCGKCEKYPCKILKGLDKRYKTKYGMSMIDNLEFIKTNGIEIFLKKEKEKWTCKKCGGIVCVHRRSCPECGNKLS